VIRVAEIHWDLLITELWLDIIQHTCDILWLVHFWVQTLKLSRLLVLLVLKSQIGNHQPPSLFEFFMHLPAALWDMRHRPNSDLCKSIYNHKFDRSGRNIRKLCHFLSHINFLCMWVIHTVLSRIDHERSHCDFSQVHHPGLGDWLGEHFSFGASAPLLRSRATDRWCRWMAGEWLVNGWVDASTNSLNGSSDSVDAWWCVLAYAYWYHVCSEWTLELIRSAKLQSPASNVNPLKLMELQHGLHKIQNITDLVRTKGESNTFAIGGLWWLGNLQQILCRLQPHQKPYSWVWEGLQWPFTTNFQHINAETLMVVPNVFEPGNQDAASSKGWICLEYLWARFLANPKYPDDTNIQSMQRKLDHLTYLDMHQATLSPKASNRPKTTWWMIGTQMTDVSYMSIWYYLSI
jgi:hypothetical protein